MKTSIIVPIFYKPELYLTIKNCLDSLKKYYPDLELITIDDSIEDCPFECTYKNKENLGYVKTINKGLEISKGDILIVANDDLTFSRNVIDPLLYIKGLTIASIQDTAGTLDNRFGCIFAMTREVYDLLGGFDERFRNFFADRDYYNKAIKNKVNVVKFFDKTIEHIESATFKRINKDELFDNDIEVYKHITS